MKYYEMTFKITGYDNSFRFKNIKPTKLLSLATLFTKSNNLASNEQIFDFALLNTEVLIIDKWLSVVEILSNGDYVYWPGDIEDNLIALNEIITTFIKEVLNKVFTSSSKSEK